MDSRFCSRSLAGKCISEVKPAGPGVAKNEGRRVYATLKVDRERNCSDESECMATHWRALEPLLSKIERHAQQIWGSLPDLKQHRATGPHGPACWHRLTYVDSTRDLGILGLAVQDESAQGFTTSLSHNIIVSSKRWFHNAACVHSGGQRRAQR